GVILLIVGMVWPNLLAYMQTATLRDHSRTVAETISHTRLGAIDYGVPHQFFYEPDGTHYLMLASEDDPASGSDESTTSVIKIPGKAGELPEGYSFKTPAGIEASQVTLSRESLAKVTNAESFSGVTWATPAVFYPDGSGTDYRFEMENDSGHFITVSIRSLTGAATLSPIQSRNSQ
ncbi:MAG TPA: hypothetical protein VLA12_11780, partial [Planctomycetaceae bacterium]|nr:hypothetical protein [Planctomycetaceae bacterium]